MVVDMQVRYHQFAFPQDYNLAERSGRRIKSWISPSCKIKCGTQEMKSCDLHVDTQKTSIYVFPRLKKYGQPKTI